MENSKLLTATLTGLDGIDEDSVEAIFIEEADQIENIFTTGEAIAVTVPGSNGAINIWEDDTGMYRCESMRHRRSLEKKKLSSLDQVEEWAEEWIVKIQ